jgi:hypothetical protein
VRAWRPSSALTTRECRAKSIARPVLAEGGRRLMKTGMKKPCIWQGFLLGAGGLVKSFDPIAEKDLSPNHGSLWDG